MSNQIATSFGTLNYSGMLFNKGNTRTPLSAIIGSKLVNTNHVEFVTGVEFTGGGSGSQPAISETASLTAPDAVAVTREQKTNVTQIFQEAFYISDAHESNMGTLSGANIAGQRANPISEFDFQAARRMESIARNIEYTFIQGAYNKATTDATINKSRGLTTAITSNVKAMSSAPLGVWDVIDMMKTIDAANAPTDDLVLWVDAVTLLQINADASANGLTIAPASRTINGIALDSILTPFGKVFVRKGECLPSGTALLLNLNVIRPVGQPHPKKGNFYLEELGKTGAGAKYQIFGQMGLDHGPEWCHGKFTGISTSFTPPAGKKVYLAGGTIQTTT